MLMEKECPKCKQVKRFHKSKARKDGLCIYCVDCTATYQRRVKINLVDIVCPICNTTFKPKSTKSVGCTHYHDELAKQKIKDGELNKEAVDNGRYDDNIRIEQEGFFDRDFECVVI